MSQTAIVAAIWGGMTVMAALSLVRGFQLGRTWPLPIWDRYSEPIRYWVTQLWTMLALIFLLVGDILILVVLSRGGPIIL